MGCRALDDSGLTDWKCSMLGCLAVPTHLESDSIASLISLRPLHEEERDCHNISPLVGGESRGQLLFCL